MAKRRSSSRSSHPSRRKSRRQSRHSWRKRLRILLTALGATGVFAAAVLAAWAYFAEMLAQKRLAVAAAVMFGVSVLFFLIVKLMDIMERRRYTRSRDDFSYSSAR